MASHLDFIHFALIGFWGDGLFADEKDEERQAWNLSVRGHHPKTRQERSIFGAWPWRVAERRHDSRFIFSMSRSDRDMEKIKRAAAPTPAISHEQVGKMDKVELVRGAENTDRLLWRDPSTLPVGIFGAWYHRKIPAPTFLIFFVSKEAITSKPDESHHELADPRASSLARGSVP